MKEPTQKDHDLLITLNVKVDTLIETVQKMADSTSVKIKDHEIRINSLEKVNDEVDPIELKKKMILQEEKLNDLLTKWKYAVATVVLFSGLIGYSLSQINNIINIFK